jgi:hypothetical protein
VSAGRFRISAREMACGRQSGVTWFISTLYRDFAAYGESPGLALFWLGFFAPFLFPAAFALTARLPPFGAVLKSLEVITFLNESSASNASQAQILLRILMGLERIIVVSQMGFFLLALRRLFPR